MRTVLAVVWRNWIKPLVLYGILYVGFRKWLDFSEAQSLVFAILFATGYFAFEELSKKSDKQDDFIPYRVSVTIKNHHDFLFKYGLVKTEEDWNALCEKPRKPGVSVLSNGLNFTVLSLGKEGGPHLIWWDDLKVFMAGPPSFEEEINEVELPYEFGGPISRTMTWSPSLYFGYQHGRGRGYTLALCLDADWWEKNKTIETIETDKDHLTGKVYLRLGELPYGELGLEYKVRGQKRETELVKAGWTIKDMDEPELNWGMTDVHKDELSVSQRFCET